MHWRNSQFQVVYFLVGKCHTPDEAYRVLKELREERQLALANADVEDLRSNAKFASASDILCSPGSGTARRYEARAEIKEIQAFMTQTQACIDEAKRELDFLEQLIVKINPLRKYAALPDHEAHQMAQQEEWLYELMTRAENYIASQGFIPHDQFATMRLHPQWTQVIQPRVLALLSEYKEHGPAGLSKLETPMGTKLPLLLEAAVVAPSPTPEL